MKLGTVLTTISAATLVMAQPALAATRWASSLPAVGAQVGAVDARVGSSMKRGEELVGVTALPILAVLGALIFLILVVADEDSFDDIDELPDSP